MQYLVCYESVRFQGDNFTDCLERVQDKNW